MKIDQIIEWVVHYHRGEMSDEEKRTFECWLVEDKNNPTLFNQYKKAYCKSRQMVFSEVVNKEKAWDHIIKAINKPKKRLIPVWASYAAAILLVGLFSTWFVWNEVSKISPASQNEFEQLAEVGSRKAILTLADGSQRRLNTTGQEEFDERDGTLIVKDSINSLIYKSGSKSVDQLIYNKIEVPRAGEYSLTLADGTKVWLNAESSLRYPVHFSKQQRDVYLTGEACFEVTHNPDAPFTVHADDTKVRVLGTQFNVSAYDDQAFITTTLVEGRVQVNYLANKTILIPGNQSLVEKGKDGINVSEVDAALYIAWVNGVFEFENKDLAYITAQLGRWYNVNFFFTESQLKHIKFTGAIKRDKSINYAIRLIESITDVTFRVEGENIIIEK